MTATVANLHYTSFRSYLISTFLYVSPNLEFAIRDDSVHDHTSLSQHYFLCPSSTHFRTLFSDFLFYRQHRPLLTKSHSRYISTDPFVCGTYMWMHRRCGLKSRGRFIVRAKLTEDKKKSAKKAEVTIYPNSSTDFSQIQKAREAAQASLKLEGKIQNNVHLF